MNLDDQIMHTVLCRGKCGELKRTGLSMGLFEKWRKHIGRRSAMERSWVTLTHDIDLSLLHDSVCKYCKANMRLDGSVELSNDDIEFVK